MEFFLEIPLIGGALALAAPFLTAIFVVVFVHEYGHYIVGRWCGIRAETFSIGFGRRLAGWVDGRGTRWQIGLIPLGGFVKFVGDMDVANAVKADEDIPSNLRKAAFHNASLGARTLTILAGPLANFLLAIVVFAGISLIQGHASDKPVIGEIAEMGGISQGFQPGDRILAVEGEVVESWTSMIHALRNSDGREIPVKLERDGVRRIIVTRYRDPPVVEHAQPGMPAAQSGIRSGDVILKLNGVDITSYHHLLVVMSRLPLNSGIEALIDRDGEEVLFQFMPDVANRPHPKTGEPVDQATMGISLRSSGGLLPTMEPMGLPMALGNGVLGTWRIIAGTVTFLGDMIFAKADTSQLGGPVWIAQVSADQAEAGLKSFIAWVGLLSVSIGLINLLPIPVLDGGHLMFCAMEALRGKPLGRRWMGAATGVGLFFILLLMGFATYNDLIRLAG